MKMVNSPNAPKAVGPYSHGVLANGILFVSGQIPINPATGKIESDEVEKQAEQCLKNVEAVVCEAGGNKQSIVKVNIFTTCLDQFAQINAVYAAFFGSHLPARAAVEVSKLPAGAKVEIEAVAWIGA